MQKEDNSKKGLLSGYTALDLTEGGYLICGRFLADLGVRVIKIEPPGGGFSRKIGPFYKGIAHPEKSFFALTYNLNKLGITLDIKKPDGKRIFEKLVKNADFVIESFPAGYMANLTLGYEELATINQRIIMVSITPYGQDGPKAGYKASDLTGWASSGVLYVTGFPERAPVIVGYPFQASMVAGTQALTASLIAHWHREMTGEGQLVDVSMQEACITQLQNTMELWDLAKFNYKRSGIFWVSGTGLKRLQLYGCKDGYVAYYVGGAAAGASRSTGALVKWMDEEGTAPEDLKRINWLQFDIAKVTQQEFDHIQEYFKRFFLGKTKRELWERSVREGILLAPVHTIADICNFPQMKERGMWVNVPYPELGEELTFWGPFAQISAAPIVYRRRAPLIGEDNETIYMGELGLTKKELYLLKQHRVI